VRAVAGAEPAAEIAGAVADGNAAEMRADAGLDQPFAGVLAREVGERAVFVRRLGRAEVRVARILVDEVGQGTSRAAAISSSVRWRMKTGLPRNRTVSCVPTATPETSTRIWLAA
jgi:hypothetical protein